jgi:hypothetical protein
MEGAGGMVRDIAVIRRFPRQRPEAPARRAPKGEEKSQPQRRETTHSSYESPLPPTMPPNSWQLLAIAVRELGKNSKSVIESTVDDCARSDVRLAETWRCLIEILLGGKER